MLFLKDFREKKGLTQQDLANLMNIHKRTVSKYERNEIFPDHEKLIKLSIILETTPNELLGFKRKYNNMVDYLESLKGE